MPDYEQTAYFSVAAAGTMVSALRVAAAATGLALSTPAPTLATSASTVPASTQQTATTRATGSRCVALLYKSWSS